MIRAGLEVGISRFQVRRPNHTSMLPPRNNKLNPCKILIPRVGHNNRRQVLYLRDSFLSFCDVIGHEYMEGMDMADAPPLNSSEVSVPAEADFVYAYSTVPGYYSWRNSVNGSWFIQSLTKVFAENAEHMDILRMLTRVNAMVSTYRSRTGDSYSDSKRQVSSIVSMPRKEVYFFPEKVTGQN